MRPLALLVVVALPVLLATPAAAQSIDEYAAWIALVRSPVGGIVNAPPAGGTAATSQSSIALNAGSWRFAAGDDETTNIGATVQLPSGRASVLLSAMLTSVKDCSDCGGFSIGGGVVYGLTSIGLGSTEGAHLDLALQPMANYGSWSDGDASALSAALSLPVSVSFPVGPLTLRPFVAPGFGYGRVSIESEAYGSTRKLLGYGLAIANRSGTIQAHVGSMSVHLEDAPSVTGVGLTIRF